jgi:hypothetical protein
MLRVTVDVFSGRPNPQWTVPYEEARNLLRTIMDAPDVVDHTDPATLGLGFRGLKIDLVSDDLHRELRAPVSFRVLGRTMQHADVVDRIMRSAASGHTLLNLRDVKHEQLSAFVQEASRDAVSKFQQRLQIDPNWWQHIIDWLKKYLEWLRKGGCPHEEITFDPAFWNDPAHVTHNNCYNFATNRRTDTFAQPGNASGHPAPVIDCNNVRAAAISDGAVQAPPCPPNDQAPRYLIALVQAPVFSPSWPHPDYHWYRRCSEGFWAHKPGGTPARNYDNSGNTVYDPETCDRGPYVNFCGYFYTQKKMVVS